jgi:hypothetical protein
MDSKFKGLQAALAQVKALKRSMEFIESSNVEPFGRYHNYKGFADSYNRIAAEYATITSQQAMGFNVKDWKGSFDLPWTLHKAHFDQVYLVGREEFPCH